MTMRKNLSPEQQEAYRQQKREIAAEWQRQNPERAKQRKREWYVSNRELCISRAAERKPKSDKPREVLTPEQREEHRQRYMRSYYNANKDAIVSRGVKNKRVYREDPLFRLKESVRSRVGSALSRKGYTKKSRTFQILGCTFEEFARHIESQFVDGMSWENKDEWHIDHKVPLGIARTEDETLKLSHYSNLRPLFAKDNFSKGDAMLEEFVPLRVKLLGW